MAEIEFTPRRGLGAFGGLVAIALLAAACGSSSGTPTSTSGSGSTTTSSAAAGGGGGGSALVKTVKNAKLGTILVDSKGFTLYRYTPDSKNKSVCTGGCASLWPPLTAPSATATIASGMSGFGTFTRSGGGLQVAYNGIPLYTYAGDSAAGQTNGQGSGGTWYVVKVGESASKGGGGGSTTSSTSSGYSY
ncbi:MAG: hypothetical protein ACLQK4_06900 [Acidimicrobiales bacterium]|jgi:predicted lipoprotein with Yx(FWY)xxD motif